MQVYSLISSLKTYHPTSHFTPWSLDLFIRGPSQLHGEHTVLQPFRRIELIMHIDISVLPGTHFHLSQVKQLRVKCLAQGQTSILRGEKHDISLKILYQAGFETARQAATSAKLRALTIAPCPSHFCHIVSTLPYNSYMFLCMYYNQPSMNTSQE